jgi:hypothetical protein
MRSKLNSIRSKLTNHLDSADMNYFQHMIWAMTISCRLFGASICCFIHAFLPFLLESQASDTIENLSEKIR